MKVAIILLASLAFASCAAMNVSRYPEENNKETSIIVNTVPEKLRRIGSQIVCLQANTNRTQAQDEILSTLKQQYKELAVQAKPISMHKSEAE